MKTEMTWKLILAASVTGGHSYWADPMGRIAVADGSMRIDGRPDTTDDGLLLLNQSQILDGEAIVLRPTKSGGASAAIPLVDEAFRASHTGAGVREAVLLGKHLGVPVRFVAEGVTFEAATIQTVVDERARERCERCGDPMHEDRTICELCRGHRGEPMNEEAP
jgi:hypothetical protein